MADPISPATTQPNYMELAADIVSAYVSNNSLSKADLPALIGSVHQALRGVGLPVQKEPEKPTPAVPVRKSITPDYLISLEDGKQYRSLKRHLTGRGLTPAQYREKWGLSADYPMVAPNYSKARSELARTSGLGQKRPAAAKAAAPSEKVTTPASTKRGRKKPA